jgi:hypothetical protein
VAFSSKLCLHSFNSVTSKIDIKNDPHKLHFIPGTDVMIFKNIFAEKFGKNIDVFCSKYFLQKFDHNIGFWEKR